MSCGIVAHHRIIQAICVEVEAINCLRIEVRIIVSGKKSTNRRVIISCRQVVETSLGIEVIASITEGVRLCNFIIKGILITVKGSMDAGFIVAPSILFLTKPVHIKKVFGEKIKNSAPEGAEKKFGNISERSRKINNA